MILTHLVILQVRGAYDECDTTPEEGWQTTYDDIYSKTSFSNVCPYYSLCIIVQLCTIMGLDHGISKFPPLENLFSAGMGWTEMVSLFIF